jgi:menaquinone-dependent protoporphyrinogen oxidase
VEVQIMKALVAFGSKRGGTAGLASMIGDELEAAGFGATVLAARQVKKIDEFDVVILAGALYANRWHRDARRFARKFASSLREKQVWLVSSGPLDDSASTKVIPPVKQVADAMASTGARGHVTFGGRLEPNAKGFPASAMAKRLAGDWRDRDQVHDWVASVVASQQST